MRSLIARGLVVLLLALSLCAGAVYFLLARPLYRPATKAEGSAVHLIGQEAPRAPRALDTRINISAQITLAGFSAGLAWDEQAPLALVVHGGPGVAPAQAWPGLEPIHRTHRVFYYHQRGAGQSSRPELSFGNSYRGNVKLVAATYGMAQHVADIERLRQISGEEKITLIGHSFGGFLATLYAAEFPERVRELVLLAPAAMLTFPNSNADLFDRVRERLSPQRKTEFAEFKARYLDFSPSLFERTELQQQKLQYEFSAFFGEAAQSLGWGLPRRTSVALPPGGWTVYGMYLSMGWMHDYTDAVVGAQVEAPVTIVLYGADLLSKQSVESFVPLFKKARLVILPKVGHFAHISNPALVAKALAR